MDEKKQERINAIARSLKELHLAATMEEAMARAKEILDSADADSLKKAAHKVEKEALNTEQDIKRMQENITKGIAKEQKDTAKNLKEARHDSEKVKDAKERLSKDVKTHSLEEGDVKEALKDVDEISCATDDADYIIDEAEKVQKKKA